MKNSYLEKLEYNKIIQTLSTFCSTPSGIELTQKLLPLNNLNKVQDLLNETNEACLLQIKSHFPSFGNIIDISIDIKLLEKGYSLNLKSLLNLASILKLSENLKIYFSKEYINPNDFPILSTYFDNLYSNKSISDKILSSIIDENTLDDNASKNLSDLRRQKKNIEQDIRSTLNKMIHSSYSKYIQENLITIRNDRFVIPVKDEYRSNVKGFIHDVSNAGSTVFIEPLSIFEMNNELTKVKNLELIEIEKILYELTSLFYPYIDEILSTYTTIGQLDFIFAKAKYSKSLNAITPVVNTQKKLNLIKARHPLIDPEKIVPVSINLGESFSTLLITGPNTGGKTVTLKTVGLLTLMACSGLNIPADEKSSIYVFDEIFADIGDDQSITNSLSTFSSHMLNIVDILNKLTSNSLVLVDELGSGTDPLEGANLAISILEHVKNIGSLTIATTHYQELKQHALISDGFENASVEFDISTLTPTYKLLIGIPGKSNAFAISKKLGLSDNIIDKAKSLLTTDEVNIEELLKNIYDNKIALDNERLEIHDNLEKTRKLKAALENEKQDLNDRKSTIIEKAKTEAREILLNAKDDATLILRDLKNVSDKSTAESMRNKLNTKIKSLSPTIEDNNDKTQITPLNPNDLTINTEVFVITLKQNGTIISNVSKSKDVQVQIGNIKMNVPIKNLRLLNNSEKQKISDKNKEKNKYSNNSTFSSLAKTKLANTELNIIGTTTLDAIYIVEKFLDDSSLSKLNIVRIVHGKGTGKLRSSIHSYLKTNPHVKSFRLGLYGEGEDGVTVVELK